jgi:hypothetical protein
MGLSPQATIIQNSMILICVGRRSKPFGNARNIPSSVPAQNTPLARLARSTPTALPAPLRRSKD